MKIVLAAPVKESNEHAPYRHMDINAGKTLAGLAVSAPQESGAEGKRRRIRLRSS